MLSRVTWVRFFGAFGGMWFEVSCSCCSRVDDEADLGCWRVGMKKVRAREEVRKDGSDGRDHRRCVLSRTRGGLLCAGLSTGPSLAGECI